MYAFGIIFKYRNDYKKDINLVKFLINVFCTHLLTLTYMDPNFTDQKYPIISY